MSSQAIKTNNDVTLLEQKINLRIESLPYKKEIKVLEAFGGEGILWNSVKEKCNDKIIKVLSIYMNNYKKVNLKGDNIKFLKTLDLQKFDIIDLDSWGSPSNQLEILKQKNYKGVIHCTFIQTMMGRINNNILTEYGYTNNMITKCQTLFSKNGLVKILYFIQKKFKTDKVRIVQSKNKNYFYFISS